MNAQEKKRERVTELLKEKGVSRAEIARRINAKGSYHASPSEVSTAISGALVSPKAGRIVDDALAMLGG